MHAADERMLRLKRAATSSPSALSGYLLPVLPSLDSDRLFIADGGMETTMIFAEGFDLPEFASFPLLDSEAGVDALRRYYGSYLEIAHRFGLGFTLDTPTWRASRQLGRTARLLAAAAGRPQPRAVALAAARSAPPRNGAETPVAICGTLGPRGDAYQAGAAR